jgi:hypothetical protein
MLAVAAALGAGLAAGKKVASRPEAGG